jgi:hypothetical protein
MKLPRKLQWPALLVAIGTVALCGSAVAAAASNVKSITTKVTATLQFKGTAGGSSTAYDASGQSLYSGDVAAEFVLPLAPPKATQIETFRTITSTDGTLRLHCSEIAKPGTQFTTGTTTGSCAVLGATGVYAGLTGSAKLAGQIVPAPDGLTGTLTDTITF